MSTENAVASAVTVGGNGISNPVGDNFTLHNPRPRTARGQRRYDAKTDAQKEHAKKVYERPAPKTFHDSSKCSHTSCKPNRKQS